MLMRKVLIPPLLLINIFSFAQTRSAVDISIGSNVISNFSGNLNLYSEATLFRGFSLNAGLGVMPFGYFYDFANRNEFNASTSFRRLSIERGQYFSIGLKRLLPNISSDRRVSYVELQNKRWDYQLVSDNPFSDELLDRYISGFRNKFSFAYGIQFFVNNNLALDSTIGLSFISDNLKNENPNRIDFQEGSGSLLLGLNIFYKL